MDYRTELKKFITSQHLYTGVRVTAGVIIPAFILYHYGILASAMAIPLGALCVSLTDTPGPVKYRRNTLIASVILNFLVALITGYIKSYEPFVFLAIIIFGMFFSLIGIYGNRINTLGSIALLVFIFNIDAHVNRQHVLYNALLFSAGGIYYTLFSLMLQKLRPYKLIQQSLGECLVETSNYLRTKAGFYGKNAEYGELFNQLMRYQVTIKQHQDDLREMLFKTRSIVRESTTKGRVLMSMFLDSIDLFERVMTSQQDYEKLHKEFDDSGILPRLHDAIILIADQLQETGLAVQMGVASRNKVNLDKLMQDSLDEFARLRSEKLNSNTLENFIMLRQILYSMEDIVERIKRLQRSSTYDTEISKEYKTKVDLKKFVERQELNPELLIDNLSFRSSHFRHAIRVTTALLIGYIISLLFPLGHGYWILLTISTILKPAFSITKQRNRQRVMGTVLGAAIGFAALYFIHENIVLFIGMLVAMILAYSFLKLNYFISSASITVYVLISFSFLTGHVFTEVMTDRLIDTAIGSIIAYVISISLLPTWEHQQIGSYILEALQANRKYFLTVARKFTGKTADVTIFKFDRKNAFVALANLSDNFQRMMSEPKGRQKKMELYHQFVSSSHMLTSYIASLSYYAQTSGGNFASSEFEPLIEQTNSQFKMAENVFKNHLEIKDDMPNLNADALKNHVQELLRRRKEEMETGKTDTKNSVRKTLSELKTIHEQFRLIDTVTIDQVRILQEIVS